MRIAWPLLLLMASAVQASFLERPALQWSYTLPPSETSNRSLRKGNAVVATEDDSLLFITAEDGSLHILRAQDGYPAANPFKPAEIQGVVTYCYSGVALAELDSRVQYAVYAVIDLLDDDVGGLQSRIIAVNPNGSLRWVVSLEGYVPGTPVIGIDKQTIYVSHNVENRVDNGEAYRGAVTVIRDVSGDAVKAALVFPDTRYAPFGPPAVQTIDVDGVMQDIVFVAEGWQNGFGDRGRVYYLLPPIDDDDVEAYELKMLSSWDTPSVTRPAVSEGAQKLWVAGGGGKVGGWVEESTLSTILAGEEWLNPDWIAVISQKGVDKNAPIPNAPVLSTDNSLVFVTTAANEIVCLYADSGKTAWKAKGESTGFAMEPKFSEAEGVSVLYVISNLTGTVQQYDAQFGTPKWTWDCMFLTGDGSCQDSVEAEFSISTSDNTLYYGDIFGKIVALQVGNFPAVAVEPPPTVAPLPSTKPLATQAPQENLPQENLPQENLPQETEPSRETRPPMDILGESTAVQSSQGSTDDGNGAKIGGIVGGIVGMAIACCLAFFLVRRHRRRTEFRKSTASTRRVEPKSPEVEEDGVATSIPLETWQQPPKRKKKKKKPLTLASSGFRLAAIEESPDDYYSIAGSTIQEGREVDYEDADDIEDYYYDDEDIESSGLAFKKSEEDAGQNEGALVPVEQQGPASYYMLDISPESAGKVIAVGSGNVGSSYVNCHAHDVGATEVPQNTLPVEETSMIDPVETDGTIVAVAQEQGQSSYAIEAVSKNHTSALMLKHLRSGASAKALTQGEQPDIDQGTIVPVSQEKGRSSYALESPVCNDIPPIPRRLPSAGSTTSSRAEEKHQESNEGAMVPVAQEPGRSAYAIKPKDSKDYRSLNGTAMSEKPVTTQDTEAITRLEAKMSGKALASKENNETSSLHRRVMSDGTLTSLYVEDEKPTEPQSRKAAINRYQDNSASVSYTNEDNGMPVVHLRRVMSDDTSLYIEDENSLVSYEGGVIPLQREQSQVNYTMQDDAIEKKSYDRKIPIYHTGGRRSPASSIHVSDDGSVEMTTDEETTQSFPLDEKSLRSSSKSPDSVSLDACDTPSKTEDGVVESIIRSSGSIRSRVRSFRKEARQDEQLSPKSPEGSVSSGERSSSSNASKTSSSSGNRLRLPRPPLPSSLSRSPERAARGRAPVLSSTSLSPKERQFVSNDVSQNESPPGLTGSVGTISSTESSERTPKITNNDRIIIPRHLPGTSTTARDMRRMRLSRTTGERKAQIQPEDSSSPAVSNEPPKSSLLSAATLTRTPLKTSSPSETGKKMTSTKRAEVRSKSLLDEEKEEKEESGYISSYISGLMKHVEEVENQFFNPVPTKKKKPSSRDPSLDTTADLSDDESLLPPPPPPPLPQSSL